MYYKVSKSNLSFNEAIEAFKKKNIIRNGSCGHVYDPSEVNLKELKFSLEEINSNDWDLLTIDNEKNLKLEEIKDIMDEINLNIDSRFYIKDRMNINDYWNLFEQQFINENLAYNIMKWFYYNKYNKTDYKKHERY